MAVPYYYSELKKGTVPDAEKNNLNKAETPNEKGHGFDNPLLAIEPDVSTCDIPRKASTFQKKKKKKKTFQTPTYLRSNSLTTNSLRLSSQAIYAHKEAISTGEGASNSPQKTKKQNHKRRSSEPNIYEEIPEQSYEDLSCYTESRDGYASHRWPPKPHECNGSSTYSSSKVVLDEVEKVQQRHVQILENLNLDVEAMLMPEETVCLEELNSETNKFAAERSNSEAKALHFLSPGTPPLYFASSHWQGGGSLCGTMPKAATTSHGLRVMNEYILQQSDFCPGGKAASDYGQKVLQKFSESTNAGETSEEPSYMLYDDAHRLQCSSRGLATPEDNIYEEVDLHQTDEEFSNAGCWIDSEVSADQYISSGSEDAEEETGAVKLAARFMGKKKKSSKKGKENERATGGFTRWFSTRKKEYVLDKCSNKLNRHSQVLYADEDGYVDVKIPKKQRPPLSLPPVPPNLSPEKLKRRYIVGSIVDSENSYLNSMQRLIRDYKHPLENAPSPIVSANKISVMFHRVEQILQCHNIFGIALTQCIRQWDQEEKIGDVFVASFSKVMVLDIYSDFINNFSLAMETAKQASKNKSAFADFLKVKQINSTDRLSFFGLMVKPVQRFPQFILMLQDLLKYSPPGHHDRMSLQLALTQLESLAETLNERKREAEQHHAVREVLKHFGKFSFKSSADRNHFLLRQDDVLQLQLDQNGLVVKSKERRLFLLNDLLLSVAVSSRNSDNLSNVERLNLKWAVPLQEVDIYDDLNMSAKTLKMFYSKSKFANHNADGESADVPTEQTLYEELRDLIHDKDIIARIDSLVSSLRRTYNDLNVDVAQRVSSSIQETIQQKCDEINQMESSCLQLAVPFRSKSNKEIFCFQMISPAVKRDWITDLRLAKLALDANNLPAWDIADQEKRPSSKMPLFVKNFPVFQTSCSSEVICGCHYVANSCSISQHYLWICSTDGLNSHIVVMAVQSTHLRQVAVYHLNEMKIVAIEAVPGTPSVNKSCSDEKSLSSDTVLSTETVWLGTENQKVIVLEGSCPEKWEELGSTVTPACIIQIKYHLDRVYVGIANGSVLIFNRYSDGHWQLENPTNLVLSQDPVACLLPVGLNLYCSSGSKIWIVDSLTAEVQRNYPIQHDDGSQAFHLAHSGTGIWMSLKNSATICLYHTETFQHLQDINIASNVNHILRGKDKEKSIQAIHVTSLLASKGLLWVGTNVGIVLTVPLPRLEGVPIITGRVSLAFHGHQGPVNLLLSLQPKSVSIPFLSSPIASTPTIDNVDPCKDLSPQSLVIKQLSDSMLPSPTSSKKFETKLDVGYIHVSGVKTLPHNQSLCSHIAPLNNLEEASDVYGLYADLMNVRDYEKDSEGKLYERLNHSDPELMHLNLNNLDKKVQQKSGRPRSWDLSTMAVSEDSDSASTATSTATTPSRNSTTDEPVQRHSEDFRCLPTHVTLRREISKSNKKTDSTPKTILMLTGGCDYINWRKPEKTPKQYLDANVIIWEVKI
ncbi:rho guanine nucleotide exchange factor 10-like protein isoform X1 [Parasteatoda tepidariorum]|nr:rho guanine nucleotide exchange factor 10 isoform X1 [Parasteatoda tepidariorum]XP_042894996.1 rho guanine nucleotide exchange factor 10 isoform X1 [Parasteatoda tepidariorum]XP_042894997.1 rho guanine nucleotide exchange factor 10 isoform X1 [Parasteatoda tepidariorum]